MNVHHTHTHTPFQVMRVYYDRLVDDSDRVWLVKYLKETTQAEFNTNFDELFKQLDSNKDGKQHMSVCGV